MSLLGRATWTSCFSRIVWGEGRSKSKRGKNKQRENGAWFLLFAARESERTACSFLEKRVARIPALKRPCGTRGSARISANVETILSSEFQSRFSTTSKFIPSLYIEIRISSKEGGSLFQLNRKYHEYPGKELVVETEFILRHRFRRGNGRVLHGIFPRRVVGWFGRFILSAESL